MNGGHNSDVRAAYLEHLFLKDRDTLQRILLGMAEKDRAAYLSELSVKARP